MLDDEEHLVVVVWIGKGFLGVEDSFEMEISGVIHAVCKVLLDCWLEGSGHRIWFYLCVWVEK